MELNGKTYEMQYLTDEEMAIIKAMRRGAEINAYFFCSTAEAAKANHAETSGALTDYSHRRLINADGTKFDSYDLKMGKHTIYHFVDK